MRLLSWMMTVAVIPLISLSGAALAQSDVPERQDLLREVHELDARFQELARSIPIFSQQEAAAYLDRAARGHEIRGVAVKAVAVAQRLTDASGEASPVELHTLEVSGTAEFREVTSFLRELRLRPVLTGLESLRIIAESSPGSSFTARITVASMTEDRREENAQKGGAGDGLQRQVQREIAKLDAVLRHIERIRSDRRLDALTRFVNSLSDDHVALSEVLLSESERIDLAGVAMGERAFAGLEKDLDDAGFIDRRNGLTGERGCRTFRISAIVPRGPVDGEVSAGRDPFDGGAERRCSVGPEPSMGSIRAGKGGGAPVIALRKVDFVDLFFALNDLFAMNFVIDEKVSGSVDLDVFDDSGTEGLLAAVRSAIDIGEGPLHRVSPSAITRSVEPSRSGEPVLLSFRRASVRDLLCLAQSIDGRELRAPKGSAARVSIFAERPLDEVVDALLWSAGFPAQAELAGSRGEPVCAALDGSPETNAHIQPHAMRLEDFGLEDLELAGVAILGSVRHAYVYTPGRVLRRIEAGQELFGGRVMEVTSRGMRVATGEGEVALTFPE